MVKWENDEVSDARLSNLLDLDDLVSVEREQKTKNAACFLYLNRALRFECLVAVDRKGESRPRCRCAF